MVDRTRTCPAPTWRWTSWLAGGSDAVPEEIRDALLARLFGTLPVFVAGAINTVLVSALLAVRVHTWAFILWFVLEVAICAMRTGVLLIAKRNLPPARSVLTDLNILFALFWAASVGYGVFISVVAGDGAVATLSCLSAAAMVGGICFRSFSAPRLTTTMILLALSPLLIAVAIAGEPLLYAVFIQGPIYAIAMAIAAFQLNQMQTNTMRAQRESDYLAKHDPLTGLLNRAGFLDIIRRLQTSSTDKIAFLFIDLDEFKIVNDTYGHSAGDRILEDVANRLKETAGSDFAARLGGDEFVLVIPSGLAEQATQFADQLTEILSRPYELAVGPPIQVGASIGTAVSQSPVESADAILQRADRAAYLAKHQRKSECPVDEPAHELRRARRTLDDESHLTLAKAS
jgi:diguanylate cyclase (GGDEF)-like protein